MNLNFASTLAESNKRIAKVTALAFSPDGMRLAAATLPDNHISLFDDKGVKREKFVSKKPGEKDLLPYCIKALCFSPDSQRLCVCQSDEIVLVYRLGNKWGEKKAISNKFLLDSGASACCWGNRLDNVVFGCLDGRVCHAKLRKSSFEAIYVIRGNPVVSIAASPDRSKMVVGHADGSLVLLTSVGDSFSRNPLGKHSCAPTALAFGETIFAAGNDQSVVFYTEQGTVQQRFSYVNDETEKEFTCAVSSPTGSSIVVAGYQRLRVYTRSLQRQQWEETQCLNVQNLYSITSLAFKRDGSKFVLGSLCGSIESFNASIKKYRYKGKFEINYVSSSQVLITRLADGLKMLISTKLQLEVVKLTIHRDRFVIAFTAESLICGDIITAKMTEIPWSNFGSEKYIFDTPSVLLVYRAGELTIIEYEDEAQRDNSLQPLATLRTQYVNPYLISVRMGEIKDTFEGQEIVTVVKRAGYLLDQQTIRIDDLETGTTLTTIQHDKKIDWLSFDQYGTRLLFRDRDRTLTLYDVASGTKRTLLALCRFVQWVSGSDGALVAQNRDTLCVWYHIDNTQQVATTQIKGDVIDVVRKNGKTEVIIDAGISQEVITLNEGLIAFSAALKERNYFQAVSILEGLPVSGETEGLWQRLCQIAMQERKLLIAQRSFTALGDIAKADYLRKTIRLIQKGVQPGQKYREDDLSENKNAVEVETRLDILDRQFKKAEYTLLHHGQVDEAVNMYLGLLKSEDAYELAITKNNMGAADIRKYYEQHLLQHKIYDKLALMKEREGDYAEAIRLYLLGGCPLKASLLVVQGQHQPTIIREIASKLEQAGLYETAGDFYVRIEEIDKAIVAYERGNVFTALVDLCRKIGNQRVIEFEKKWAEYLEHHQQYETSIAHYLECYAYEDAVRAAIKGKQWTTAIQIMDSFAKEGSEKGSREKQIEYYRIIAKHYEEIGNLTEAETFYIKANLFDECITMYLRHDQFEKGYGVAARYYSEDEVVRLHITQASELEKQQRLREAEQLLLRVREYDLAIGMYKKCRQFDDMIRLVTQFRKEHLSDTYRVLAEQMEDEGNYKLAEKYYVSSGNWKSAVSMYRQKENWEDAMRVARSHGNVKAAGQVCWVYAKTLGGDAGVVALIKYGFVDNAIRLCLDNKNFVKAETLAKEHSPSKLSEVYLTHAVFLEQQQKFTEAEEEFIRADQPKEAVLMYANIRDWVSAGRIAQSHCPEAMTDIFEQQAIAAQEAGEYSRAEQLFLRAKKPQLAVEMYLRVNLPDSAERIKKEFLYSDGTSNEFDTIAQNGGGAKSIEYILRRAEHEPQFFTEAIKLARDQNMLAGRFDELLNLVTHKLRELSRFDQIAAIYLNYTDRARDAIDALISGGLFKDAYEVAQTKLTAALPTVRRAHMNYAAQNKQWDICLELATKEGTEISARFAADCVNEKLQQDDLAGACTVFVKYGIVPVPHNVPIYHTLAQRIFSASFHDGIENVPPTKEDTPSSSPLPIPVEPSLLKEVYFRLMSDMSAQHMEFNQNVIEDFAKLQFIVHTFNQYYECTKYHLVAQRAKCATSLLRYFGAVPADKAYYIAGMAQLTIGGSLAFVFLNRFLDITEAIDEGEQSLANEGFEETDLAEVLTIPRQAFLPENKQEEVRNWLLQQVSDSDTDAQRVLPTRPCEKCAAQIFEGSLWCCHCKATHEPCIVTGYPVLAATRVQCKSCGKQANRDDWNKYVMDRKVCPWCNDLQGPIWK